MLGLDLKCSVVFLDALILLAFAMSSNYVASRENPTMRNVFSIWYLSMALNDLFIP